MSDQDYDDDYAEEPTSQGPRLWVILLLAIPLALVALAVLVPNCVLAGTRVATPDGERLVQDLRVGDPVWCQAPDGTRVAGRVTWIEDAAALSHLTLTFADATQLRVTGAHPLSTTRGWVEAADLQVGDDVHALGAPRRLARTERSLGAVTVYDLSVTPYPNFFADGLLVHNKSSRKHGNESTAIGSLKTISVAQTLFREADKEGDDVLDYGSLHELANSGTTGLIDQVLGSGTKFGYLYECSYSSTTPEFMWYATANPIEPGDSGDRYFCTNHEGVTFYRLDKPFALNNTDCTIPADAKPVGR